jgi:predicted O-linked N-acetylglucosamine transferase (SPINDLY family)
LLAFAEIDLSLDPFPHNGGASTWESLYMGVPVITKLGETAGGRLGGAIMTAVGFAEFVAADENEYIAIARDWANRPDDLTALRRDMRGRLANSDAGDPVRYCRHLEALYRRFWMEYCASPPTASDGHTPSG